MVTKDDKKAAASEPCEFDETLDSIGADGIYWAEKLKELSGAMETKALIPKGERKFVYSKKMVAWDTRSRAQDMAHKLRGDYKPEKKELSGAEGGPVEVSLIKQRARAALEQSKKAKENE